MYFDLIEARLMIFDSASSFASNRIVFRLDFVFVIVKSPDNLYGQLFSLTTFSIALTEPVLRVI